MNCEKARIRQFELIYLFQPECDCQSVYLVAEFPPKYENSTRNESSNSSKHACKSNLRAAVFKIFRISNDSRVDAREEAEVESVVDKIWSKQGHFLRENKLESSFDRLKKLGKCLFWRVFILLRTF